MKIDAWDISSAELEKLWGLLPFDEGCGTLRKQKIVMFFLITNYNRMKIMKISIAPLIVHHLDVLDKYDTTYICR